MFCDLYDLQYSFCCLHAPYKSHFIISVPDSVVAFILEIRYFSYFS
jgi:hypothetical protein